LLVAALAGCPGTSSTTGPSNPTGPSDAKPADPDSDVAIQSLVTSMVVIEACPDSKRIDSKAANREIEELVGPCKKVPGGAAHFSATLMPGGQVELGSPTGDRANGIVPTCVLQQQKQLKHKLRLTKACKFEVKLEERVAEKP
jgi:hypothetical protein